MTFHDDKKKQPPPGSCFDVFNLIFFGVTQCALINYQENIAIFMKPLLQLSLLF